MIKHASRRIEIAPNCSLTPRSALWFFAPLCAVSLTVAGLLTSQGFWPVLPFAGLEMGVLAWALHVSLRRRFQSEAIIVSEAEVAVEARNGRRLATAVFPRHWAQVKLRAARSPLHPSSLTIESHGRACEIGAFLTEEERRGLAGRLRALIGHGAESSPPTDESHRRP